MGYKLCIHSILDYRLDKSLILNICPNGCHKEDNEKYSKLKRSNNA